MSETQVCQHGQPLRRFCEMCALQAELHANSEIIAKLTDALRELVACEELRVRIMKLNNQRPFNSEEYWGALNGFTVRQSLAWEAAKALA